MDRRGGVCCADQPGPVDEVNDTSRIFGRLVHDTRNVRERNGPGYSREPLLAPPTEARWLLIAPVDVVDRSVAVYHDCRRHESSSRRHGHAPVAAHRSAARVERLRLRRTRRAGFRPCSGVGGAITGRVRGDLRKAAGGAAAGTRPRLLRRERRDRLHACEDQHPQLRLLERSYTYVREGDGELRSFSIEHDMRYRIPLIRQAMAAAGGRLTLFRQPVEPARVHEGHR